MADSTSTTTYNILTRPAAMLVGGSSSNALAKKQPVVLFENYNQNPDQQNPNQSPAGVNPAAGSAQDMKDWRVRISLPPGANKTLYNSIAGADFLSVADGVLFPYTPQMTVTFNARYNEQALTHSNYKSYFYEGSDISPITLSGIFTAQNEKEAVYVQSCINFLRAVTKMRFGTTDPLAGQPPTLVRLSGYGSFYMPAVTCIVTQFSHTMPEDVDYIPFTVNGQSGRIPIASTMSVTLQPVYSRQRQSASFKLDDFVQGKLITGGTNTYSISQRNDVPGGMI